MRPCYPRPERVPGAASAARLVALPRLANGDQRARSQAPHGPTVLPQQIGPRATNDAETAQLGRSDALTEGDHEADAVRAGGKRLGLNRLDADPASAQLPGDVRGPVLI